MRARGKSVCRSQLTLYRGLSTKFLAVPATSEGIITMNGRPNIVLVHGAWADGSCWSAVIAPAGRRPRGHRTPVPGHLAGGRRGPAPPGAGPRTAHRRRRPLVRRPDHDRPRQDAPNVVGLVYVAAFGLDEGESIGGLLAQGGPPDPRTLPSRIDEAGLRVAAEDDFVEHFAGDVDPVEARSCTPCSSRWPHPRSTT